MAEWQPIESAPETETEFLVWNPEWRSVTQWNGVAFWQARRGEGLMKFTEPEVRLCTHWMPLPPPPAQKDQPQ